MKKFLKKHDACREGYRWAVENCTNLDEVWQQAKPELVVWLATRPGVLTDRELHEFALWCAGQVRHLMTDPRSIAALDTKRAWLDGLATDEELNTAWVAAWDAARDAARAAAWDTAWAAAWDAARAAAWVAARGVARDAARAAAWDAAWVAARGVAWYAARDAQKQYLLENCKPNWR